MVFCARLSYRMNNQHFIADLHCHPQIKAFNSGHPTPAKNMWEKIFHKTDHNRFAERITATSKNVLKESQCNLYTLAEANVRVFTISLYPIEKGFLNIRNVPRLLIGKIKLDIMHEVITGFDSKRISYLKKSPDYFTDLVDEYNYVRQSTGPSPDGQYQFEIATNYTQLQKLLKQENTIIGVMSIEGAHSLGSVGNDIENLSLEEQKEIMSERIRQLKQWEYPPFTINLAHHFWNGLSGHARSFKLPTSALLNQNKGIDKGITPLGWHVVRELLSRHNGKRILVDVKHMSALARREYYNFLENYNHLHPDDKIPVIFSHAGINGFSTLESSVREADRPAKTRHHRLYKWSINASNDECRFIHESGGLIGIMMDKGNLGGIRTIRETTAVENSEQQRREYCRIFWDNCLQAVKAIGHERAWEVLSLGSDYEGTITHMDPYEGSGKLPLFFSDLQTYLEDTGYHKELWFDHSPSALVNMIKYQNAMQFYKQYFV